MDLLDRLLGHDAWTTRQLLLRAQGLGDAQLDQDFDMSHRTVRATFLHIVWNMEAWTDGMEGRELRPNPGKTPEGRTIPGLLARLDAAEVGLARVARSVRDRGALDERWRDQPDDPTSEKTYGGAIAHVITHSMHHRAQAIYMLGKLGLKDLPEGDVLSWEQQAARS